MFLFNIFVYYTLGRILHAPLMTILIIIILKSEIGNKF